MLWSILFFRPSLEIFGKLLEFAKTQGSWDGGDQGLLNSYFSDWSTKDISRHLPFGYNVHAAATYAYLPAFEQFKKDIKVIHFLGQNKPWKSRNCPSEQFSAFWDQWWNYFTKNDIQKPEEVVEKQHQYHQQRFDSIQVK